MLDNSIIQIEDLKSLVRSPHFQALELLMEGKIKSVKDRLLSAKTYRDVLDLQIQAKTLKALLNELYKYKPGESEE